MKKGYNAFDFPQTRTFAGEVSNKLAILAYILIQNKHMYVILWVAMARHNTKLEKIKNSIA